MSSSTIGDYEAYLTKELVETIDANYRTIPSRENRGIMGCSMGADGALHLALKYPDVYSVAAPYSGTYDWAKEPSLKLGHWAINLNRRISPHSRTCDRRGVKSPWLLLLHPIQTSRLSSSICPM